ncbi:PRTRC system ThiF family protein (plasmid) [Deinococcus radiomollis]|uniref:PRTRC system ThiF family protein n=1 Tax=Deinococcus radiomollis TaxID=468916 RepID=UPI0038921DC3
MQVHALKFNPKKLVKVIVVGAGGTGSSLLTYLTDVHKCMVALGGEGLMVHAFDDALISSVNVIRQNYSPAEVGRNKAISLITRINLSVGCAWRAYPVRCVQDHVQEIRPDVLITCTDTRVSRQSLGTWAAQLRVPYWIDTGNSVHTGQVILSEPGVFGPHLPSPIETHGAHLKDKTEDGPSCSALEALSRQDLMINREVALQATRLIWRLLADGSTESRGCYVDTRSGQVMPLPVEAGMVKKDMVSVGLIVPEVQPVKKEKPEKVKRPAENVAAKKQPPVKQKAAPMTAKKQPAGQKPVTDPVGL